MKKKTDSLLKKMGVDLLNMLTPAQVHKLFSWLSEEQAETLIRYGKPVEVKAGQSLFQAGSPADSLFFLIQGRLGVSKETGFNKKWQVIALLNTGSVVGEGVFVGKTKRSATVVVIEDSFLLELNLHNFKKIEKDHPVIALSVMKRLLFTATVRLEKCSERLVHIL